MRNFLKGLRVMDAQAFQYQFILLDMTAGSD